MRITRRQLRRLIKEEMSKVHLYENALDRAERERKETGAEMAEGEDEDEDLQEMIWEQGGALQRAQAARVAGSSSVFDAIMAKQIDSQKAAMLQMVEMIARGDSLQDINDSMNVYFTFPDSMHAGSVITTGHPPLPFFVVDVHKNTELDHGLYGPGKHGGDKFDSSDPNKIVITYVSRDNLSKPYTNGVDLSWMNATMQDPEGSFPLPLPGRTAYFKYLFKQFAELAQKYGKGQGLF